MRPSRTKMIRYLIIRWYICANGFFILIMKAVVQRVQQASVSIEGELKGSIKQGLLVLLGIDVKDDAADVQWMCNKLVQLRIFSDEAGKMNLSLKDIKGGLMLVSQFTLLGDAAKGNRPSFMAAARPEQAVPLYELAIRQLEALLGHAIETGTFGADMAISLINDGPVTLILESPAKA
jgi:D-tyrosyl-tRNA(Tyr) deacylase